MNGSAIAGINQQNAVIRNCYNTGTIIGNRIAGVSMINSGNIYSCYNKGTINSQNIANTSQESAGIVVSNEETGKISNCYNSGNVMRAGICGNNYGIVEKSFNEGKVCWQTVTYVGGIVGVNRNLVINCYNLGTVQAADQVGGIVGLGLGANNQVKNCYNTGNITGYNHVNAITGNGPAGINCYYLDTSTKDKNSSVISKTKEELQSEEILTLLNNEEEVWTHDINKNNGFPIIINE